MNPPSSETQLKSRTPLIKLFFLMLVLFCASATPVSSHAKTVLDDGLEGGVYLEETVGD